MARGEPVVRVGIVVETVASPRLGARPSAGSVVGPARRAGLPKLTVGPTVVAAGASVPELIDATGATPETAARLAAVSAAMETLRTGRDRSPLERGPVATPGAARRASERPGPIR